MKPDEWSDAAMVDANRRGLRDIRPLVETLAKAIRAHRDAEWNDDPRAETGRPLPRDRSVDHPRT